MISWWVKYTISALKSLKDMQRLGQAAGEHPSAIPRGMLAYGYTYTEVGWMGHLFALLGAI